MCVCARARVCVCVRENDVYDGAMDLDCSEKLDTKPRLRICVIINPCACYVCVHCVMLCCSVCVCVCVCV